MPTILLSFVLLMSPRKMRLCFLLPLYFVANHQIFISILISFLLELSQVESEYIGKSCRLQFTKVKKFKVILVLGNGWQINVAS